MPLTPKAMKEFLQNESGEFYIPTDILSKLNEFAGQWELEQKTVSKCINDLLESPAGYVDPTTLLEFRYSNVISGRIYADGDHAYIPVFTKDQLDDTGILDLSYIDIKIK